MISHIITTIICRSVEVLLICLMAYGATKEDEPNDWVVWTAILTAWILIGLVEMLELFS